MYSGHKFLKRHHIKNIAIVRNTRKIRLYMILLQTKQFTPKGSVRASQQLTHQRQTKSIECITQKFITFILSVQ